LPAIIYVCIIAYYSAYLSCHIKPRARNVHLRSHCSPCRFRQDWASEACVNMLSSICLELTTFTRHQQRLWQPSNLDCAAGCFSTVHQTCLSFFWRTQRAQQCNNCNACVAHSL